MVKTLIAFLIAGLAAAAIAYATAREPAKITGDFRTNIKDTARSRALRLLAAALLPIGGMVLYVWSFYAFHLVRTIPKEIDLLIFFGVLLSGTSLLSFGPWTRRTKMWIIVTYVPVMVLALLYAWLSTSCGMGDCL
jgi:hypothetical protein